MSNRLSAAHSLYLRQHGDDPVDWHPWGEEAFARAEEEDRPILLSIGYASCHWCHVMAEESFSDPEVAELMNRLFVNVKVDREERPDVDAIHMRAVQSLTGRGGWPMTVFLTPEGVPFHGGTYYPPTRRHGLPAFRELLEAIAEAWAERRPALLAGAGEMRELLRRSLSAATPALPEESSAPAGEDLALGVTAIEESIDPVHGGMASPQKFPQSSLLDLLLHAATGAGGASVPEDPGSPLGMALHWSRALLRGGIHDHLGGGFHRYTVDPRWDVPHFEKLLPDQALLARSLHAGWRLSGDPELRAGAEATILHLLEDLRLEEGGFAASLDADSEGREGAFYLWSPESLTRLLTPEEQAVFRRHFTLVPAPEGEGDGVLRRLTPFRRGGEEEPVLDRLREIRSRRPHPPRDPKMVTGWNALAIRALCEIGTSFERPEWVTHGETALGLLLDPFLRTGTLPRILGRGAPGNPGLLEDHAALGNALLSLHEATLSTAALDHARAIASVIRTRFWEDEGGLLFDTDGEEERLVIRPRDPSDGATPSGTSMALEFWQRLAALTGDPEGDRERIERVLEGERLRILRGPLSVPGLLIAADRERRLPTEIVILGGDDPKDRAPFLVQAHRAASPFRVITGEGRDAPLPPVGRDDAGERSGPRRPPLLEGRHPPPAGVTALVCRGGSCSLPLSAPEGLRSLAEG